MTRILTALIAVAATFCVNAEVWQAEYGVARVFNFKLYNADGTLDVDEADGGTEVSLSCNEGAETTATNDFADEGNFYSISLTAAELQCERVAIVVAATTTEVFFVETFGHASGFNETLGWLTGDAFARLGAPAGASIAADIVTLDNFIDTEVADILTDTSTTLDDFIDTEIASLVTAVDNVDNFVDTEVADIRRAIGPATTTIASLSSQTSFTLTAGSADDNAYNGYGIVVIDASTATQTALGCVLDYTGASKTITLNSDPGVFTMATTDNVVLLPAYCTTVGSGLDAAGVRAAVGLASANLDTQLSTIDDYVDTEVAAILVDTGTTLDDFLDTEVAAILSDTNAILVDTGTTLDDFLDTEVAAILAAVDTEVADIPTNAELATALGTADDATLAAIAALNDITTAEVRDLVIEDQGGVTLGCAIAVVLAYAAGDLSTVGGNSTYEDPSGTETRATGTVASAGNRTAAITCPTY